MAPAPGDFRHQIDKSMTKEPDKEILQKLWENKWSRWIMILALGWQILSGLKEPILILYDKALKPIAVHLSGTYPSVESVSSERHSFLAGYYSYELFSFMRSQKYKEWPHLFSDYKNRLEASLVAVGFPNGALVQEIDPTEPLNALEKYQRLRNLAESYLDKKSEKDISAFYIGLYLALLIAESSAESPSKATIDYYIKEIKEKLYIVRQSSLYRLAKLPLEDLDIQMCCKEFQLSFVNSFLQIKKYYGVTLS